MKDTNNRYKNLEWFLRQSRKEQLEIFQDYTEMLKIVANNLLKGEIEEKCGERYSREKQEEGRYSRWGYNPGSIKIGEEKIPISVPRYIDNQTRKAENAEIYTELKEQEKPTNEMLKSILLGLSQKDYGRLSKTLAESFVQRTPLEE